MDLLDKYNNLEILFDLMYAEASATKPNMTEVIRLANVKRLLVGDSKEVEIPWLDAECGCKVYALVKDPLDKKTEPTSYRIDLNPSCDRHRKVDNA